MRRSIFNVFTVAAGAVLVAALGVSAHAQISNGISRAGVHSQVTTLHTETAEVATEARDAEPTDIEQTKPKPQATDEAEAQDTEAADNETETGDNTDEQGDNNTQTNDQTGDSGGAGGD
jgi:hypothetical protein